MILLINLLVICVVAAFFLSLWEKMTINYLQYQHRATMLEVQRLQDYITIDNCNPINYMNRLSYNN